MMLIKVSTNNAISNAGINYIGLNIPTNKLHYYIEVYYSFHLRYGCVTSDRDTSAKTS